MDDRNKYMDNLYTKALMEKKQFSSHTGAFRRQFSVLPALDAAGYLPEKDNWISTEFSSWNFSIILSGNGTYYAEGEEYQVIPPCVLTQQPGIHVQYGPESSWEELFFIYAGKEADKLLHGNVFPGRQSSPVWYFSNLKKTRAAIRLLGKSLNLLQDQQYADTIDLSAYETIISTINHPYQESLTGNMIEKTQEDFAIILAAETYIRLNPAETLDIDSIAAENGMHPARFRRLWNNLFDAPPHRYTLQLRLIQAAKLLAESTMQVQEVADITGFRDSLYFSRMFKQKYGTAPKFYREKYAGSLINT